jgi:hypothetical protein
VGHVACTGEITNARNILVDEAEVERMLFRCVLYDASNVVVCIASNIRMTEEWLIGKDLEGKIVAFDRRDLGKP